MKNIPASLRLLRPDHWIKNIMVLLPVLFAMRLSEPAAWARALIAAGAFCWLSSAIYVLNDIVDRQRDRLHPIKRKRPVASGEISVSKAFTLAGASLVLAAAFWMLLLLAGPSAGSAKTAGLVLVGYLLLQIAYSLWLKFLMILDVICIAMGFVLRALAGAVAIGVAISPWLFVMAFTLCLFMGFCKRYSEKANLPDDLDAQAHRATLVGYQSDLLTHLVTLSASIAVVGMILYSLDERTVAHYGTHYLVYTLPIFLYGVFRFAMLTMSGRYAGPTELILQDLPFQLTALIWVLSAGGIIYWGPVWAEWMGG